MESIRTDYNMILHGACCPNVSQERTMCQYVRSGTECGVTNYHEWPQNQSRVTISFDRNSVECKNYFPTYIRDTSMYLLSKI